MEELKIYSVTDEYIDYLRKYNSNVYSNKQNYRTHTRKYIGVVIKIEDYDYYIPMSSPKETDYQVAVVRKLNSVYAYNVYMYPVICINSCKNSVFL